MHRMKWCDAPVDYNLIRKFLKLMLTRVFRRRWVVSSPKNRKILHVMSFRQTEDQLVSGGGMRRWYDVRKMQMMMLRNDDQEVIRSFESVESVTLEPLISPKIQEDSWNLRQFTVSQNVLWPRLGFSSLFIFLRIPQVSFSSSNPHVPSSFLRWGSGFIRHHQTMRWTEMMLEKSCQTTFGNDHIT